MDILLEAYDDGVCMLVVGMLLFLSESYRVSSVTSFGRGARWLAFAAFHDVPLCILCVWFSLSCVILVFFFSCGSSCCFGRSV
jgi:hypothetical protein